MQNTILKNHCHALNTNDVEGITWNMVTLSPPPLSLSHTGSAVCYHMYGWYHIAPAGRHHMSFPMS